MIKDKIARVDSMARRRSGWVDHWQDVLDYILPQRSPVNRESVVGEKRTSKQYDSTATRFMRRLASTLMGLMVSPSSIWFGLRADGAGDEANDWLDASADTMYAALRESNFYQEIAETLIDLISIGTAALHVDEKRIKTLGFNGFLFRNLAAGEYYLDEGPDGDVDTIARTFELTPRQAAVKFGETNLHESMREDLSKDEVSWPFIHLVYRADDPLLGKERRRGDRSIRNAAWKSCYIDRKNEHEVVSGGFRDQRYFVGRWSKASGEIWGRSPAMDVLPDVKTLNTLRRYILEGAVTAVYPPWLFPSESLVGRLNLTPGYPNFYDPTVEGEIKPLQGKSDFRVGQLAEGDLREAIAQGFMDDILGMKDGDVTATEVLDRRERRQQITGPAVSRIETEILEPLVKTCWLMMFRAGSFGRPPEGILNAESLDIEYLSPLARAQRLGSARAMQDVFAILQPLAQVVPGMLDHYDFDRIARDIPEDMGVPGKWVRDEDVVARGRQLRAQQRQAAQNLEQGKEIAGLAMKAGG